MTHKMKLCCVFLGTFIPMLAGAFDEVDKVSCGEINGAKDFISCALKAHPDARGTVYDQKKAEGLVQQAKRIPNPELETEVSQTDNIGQISDTVGLKLLIPIEVGGKRGDRIKKSKKRTHVE